MISLTEIQTFFHGAIKLGEPVAGYAALGVGGPVDYLFEPESSEEREKLISYLQRNEFPYVVLQQNMVISEKGFRGAVIIDRANGAVQVQSTSLFSDRPDVSVQELLANAEVNGVFLGGAEIADNNVVNARNATAGEIYSLVHLVQRIIKNQSGILLETELQFIGFEEESFVRVA